MIRERRQEGAALIMAVFVMAILASLGIAMVFMGEINLKSNKVSLNTKKAFYLAESGIETGRWNLFDASGGSEDFGPRLEAAAGEDGTIDFDPDALRAEYETSGEFREFTGYGDDVPLLDVLPLGAGVHAAFLTNDPLDGRTNLTDSNGRVMITGVGVGPNNSFRVVEALVEPEVALPPLPSAVVTLIGPGPSFVAGTSDVEIYNGEDCYFLGGGTPDLHLPIVGTTGADAEADADGGMTGSPDKYTSGEFTGQETGVDLTDETDPLLQEAGLGAIHPVWQDCGFLQDLLARLREHATHHCDMSDGCTLPESMTLDDILFIDGSIRLGPGFDGSGLLVVTGELEITGDSTWRGVVLAIGEGQLVRSGGGGGVISGTSLVANIAGPNGVFGDADDCRAEDSVESLDDETEDSEADLDAFGSAEYQVTGGGNADIDYCTRFLATGALRYHVVGFRQL